MHVFINQVGGIPKVFSPSGPGNKADAIVDVTVGTTNYKCPINIVCSAETSTGGIRRIMGKVTMTIPSFETSGSSVVTDGGTEVITGHVVIALPPKYQQLMVSQPTGFHLPVKTVQGALGSMLNRTGTPYNNNWDDSGILEKGISGSYPMDVSGDTVYGAVLAGG